VRPRNPSGQGPLLQRRSERLMLPARDIAPPLSKSEASEVAIDAFHHTVYVVATGFAFATRPAHVVMATGLMLAATANIARGIEGRPSWA
jgi:hypothetical protein